MLRVRFFFPGGEDRVNRFYGSAQEKTGGVEHLMILRGVED